VEILDTGFVMADIAGIIEGAHEGAGLGHEFLKHIERTKLLIHIVDISGSEGRDAIEDFEKINKELELYSERLAKRHQIVVANKIDIINEEDEKYIEFKKYVEEKGFKVFPVSAPINLGVREVLAEAAAQLDMLAKAEEEEIYEFFDFEKDERDETYRDVYASKDGEVFILTGKQLEKIFNSTNFNDIGSLRYLHKYIEKSGGLDKLKEMGLEDGGTIKIKNFEFEYFED